MVSFDVQNDFNFMKYNFLLLILLPVPIVFSLESLSLCQFPHFLFCQVQCIWFYVEVFDPCELEFCAGWWVWICYIILHTALQFDKHHLLKMLFFIQFAFLGSLSNSGVQSFVNLCLGFQVWFYWSINLYANAMLLLL